MAPNILLVVADDQPKGLMNAMPWVSANVKDLGVQLANYICPTSLCSPSRAAFLTGKNAHNNGVWTNYDDPYGGYQAFAHNESNALSVKLQQKGYYTALVGKYINKFSSAPAGYVPPGWNQFITMITSGGEGAGSYYDYDLVGTSPSQHYGSAEADYSTDVLAQKAVNVINDAQASPAKPLFLMYTPWGPHGDYEAAPRHLGTYTGANNLPGSFNEADLSDKPTWMQSAVLQDQVAMTDVLQKSHETVMSIDEGVAKIYDALVQAGRSTDLLLIYVSDNGKMLGSHRMGKKDLPHRWSSEVPCFIRYTGHITPGETDTRVTTNVDITATIGEVAGLSVWVANSDGKSYLTANRLGTVVEQMDNAEQDHPGYVGWRTKRYLYARYTNGGGEELYDYTTDPDELVNVINDPAYVTTVIDLRSKAQANCVPLPPGYIW